MSSAPPATAAGPSDEASPAPETSSTPSDSGGSGSSGGSGEISDLGVTLTSEADLESLDVADGLKDHLRETLSACSTNPQIKIEKYRADDLASGSTFCAGDGGADALFYEVDGAWKTYGTQAVPQCSEIEQLGIEKPPPGFVGSNCT